MGLDEPLHHDATKHSPQGAIDLYHSVHCVPPGFRNANIHVAPKSDGIKGVFHVPGELRAENYGPWTPVGAELFA